MGFLSSLVKGAIGFFTGGPAGAAAGVASDLLGGGQSGSAPKQLVRANIPAADLDNDDTTQWRAYLDQIANGQKPVTYSAQRALNSPPAGQVHMQQISNRLGGMQSHGRPNGIGLVEDRGPGYGAAGDEKEGVYQEALSRVRQQNTSYAQPYSAAFGNYMQKSLAGQNGLPQAEYDRQLLQGQAAINRQAMQSRQQLAQNLGQRGLMHSGMMAQGLSGVEQSKLGAYGQLTTGLAQQNLEAQRQAQAQAASMYPELIRADQSQTQNMLALRQLELQAQQLGISQQQLHDALQNDKWNLLAGLGAAYMGYRYGGSDDTAQTQQSGSGWYNIGSSNR